MYLSLAVEGNNKVCAWTLLNDEQLRPTGDLNVSQALQIAGLQSLDVFFSVSCGEVDTG